MNRFAVDAALGFWGVRLFGRERADSGPAKGLGAGRISCTAPADGVRAKLRTLLSRAPEVMVKVTGGGRGMAPIRAQMAYISRNGALELEDERGEKIQGREALRDLVQEWRFARSAIPSRSHRREALNVMLSMPLGTDGQEVFGAAREFAKSALAQHKFAMVLHEPQTDPRSHRPHVHVIVRKQGQDGSLLTLSNADLALWRQQFAERLQERGIAASATRRHMRGQWLAPARAPEEGLRPPEQEIPCVASVERQAGAELDVLAAWHGVVTALSRSEDPEDQTLARQTLTFVRQMPIVARRQWLGRASDPALLSPQVTPLAPPCEQSQADRASGRNERDRTR